MDWEAQEKMKKYGDETLIRILQDGLKDAGNTDIQKGSVRAGDQKLVFMEQEIVKNQMWMWLPKQFTLLSKEYAKIKYPSENRPALIYSNPETTVNLTFSHKQEKLAAGQEAEVCDAFGQVMRRLYPTCRILQQGLVQARNNQAAWMDFVVPAMDTAIYNLLFVTPVKGRMLIGTCNCPQPDQEDWEDLFVQMITTIRTV